MIFKIMSEKGDVAIDYGDKVAEIKFNELVASGMLPVKQSGGKDILMQRYEPNVDEVKWIPAIAGG